MINKGFTAELKGTSIIIQCTAAKAKQFKLNMQIKISYVGKEREGDTWEQVDREEFQTANIVLIPVRENMGN